MTQDNLHEFVTHILVALGSNLPSDLTSSEGVIRAAITRIEAGLAGQERLRAQSRLYRTPCFPPGPGPDFVNAVIALDMAGAPQAILARLHAIEAEFGRDRATRWGARTLDLDLLACGDAVLPDVSTYSYWRDLDVAHQRTDAPGDLILPHPRLQDRAFVLVPLNEVAPGWRHPVSGLGAAEMLARLDPAEIDRIRPL